MLSKTLLVGLAALATLSEAVHTPPSTKCTTIGTLKHPTRVRTYTRTGTCTNALPHKKTVQTTTTTQATSTSTVVETDTETAATSTDTATDTVTETDTVSETNTETATSTVFETATTTQTVSYPTGANNLPNKRREIEERAAGNPTSTRSLPPNAIVCGVTRCHATRSTTTVTSTSVLPEATATETSTQTTTVTPNAETTVTETDTVTSTSSFTATTTETDTQTSTSTVTYTATPTFYIMSSNNPNIPDGTNLTNVPDRQQGEGQASFTGAGTLFALDPTSGELYDATNPSNPQIANADKGANSVIYFDTQALIVDGGYPVCNCAIDSSLNLDCTCGGNSIFQTGGSLLYMASSANQRGLVNEQPVVQIVNEQ